MGVCSCIGEVGGGISIDVTARESAAAPGNVGRGPLGGETRGGHVAISSNMGIMLGSLHVEIWIAEGVGGGHIAISSELWTEFVSETLSLSCDSIGALCRILLREPSHCGWKEQLGCELKGSLSLPPDPPGNRWDLARAIRSIVSLRRARARSRRSFVHSDITWTDGSSVYVASSSCELTLLATLLCADLSVS